MSHQSSGCYQLTFKNLILMCLAMGEEVKPKEILRDLDQHSKRLEIQYKKALNSPESSGSCRV